MAKKDIVKEKVEEIKGKKFLLDRKKAEPRDLTINERTQLTVNPGDKIANTQYRFIPILIKSGVTKPFSDCRIIDCEITTEDQGADIGKLMAGNNKLESTSFNGALINSVI